MAQQKYNKEFYDGNYSEFVLKRPRNKFKQFIRNLYLNNARKLVIGKAIDFGCGAGELLEILPKGSIGLEVIPEIVQSNQKKGLNVKLFDPEKDGYTFESVGIKHGEYQTLISLHVFEHLENSHQIIKQLFSVCEKIGIQRIVIIVPGHMGFKSLPEHISYVSADYLQKNGLTEFSNYKQKSLGYFPFNILLAGEFFTHNEMVVVWERNK